MKNQPNSHQLIKIFLAISVVCITKCQQLVDDNYSQLVDNNIPQPTKIQIQKQIIKINAQSTIPNIIKPPSIIYPLYYSRIQNKIQQNCTIEYLDEQKSYGDYIKFNKTQLGKFQGWNIEILDATYDFNQQIIYAILTNGSFIKSKFQKQTNGKGNQINGFSLFDYHKSEVEQIWELDAYELYSTNGQVYLLKEKQLFKANFQNNNKWGMQLVPNGDNINKVHQQRNELYLVKSKSIHKLFNKTISTNLFNFLNPTNEKVQFIDLDIDKNYMYVLCKFEGVLLINVNNHYELVSKYVVDFHEYAYRINVKNNTALINFKLYRKTFIGEFFFIPSNVQSYPPTFKLNKFYYRFDQMNNLVQFQDFGIVYSLSQLNFFQHSINRNSPFGELQTQNIYRASYPKILDVIPLDQTNLHYILVQKNGIFVESLGSSQTTSLLKSQIKCVFHEAGNYNVTVIYDGFCKQNKKPTQSYCTKTQTYMFEVNNEKVKREVQAFNEHMFIVLILLVAFVLVIGGILTYRRITLQNEQRLNILISQKQKFNEMSHKPTNQQINQHKQTKQG